MFTNRLLYLLIAFALLVVTACAPQAEITSTVTSVAAATLTSTAEPTPVPTATQTPTTTVQPTKTATTIPVYLPFQAGKYIPSHDPNSYYNFGEDGRWAHYAGGTLLASGTYRVEGDIYFQLTNSHGCPPMSFKYTFDGKFLKFQLTDESRNDTCGDRKDMYNNKIYTLSE